MRFELKEEGREEEPRRKRNNELQAGRKGWAAKGFNEDERDKPTSGSVSLPIHLLFLSFSHTFPLHPCFSSTFSSLFSSSLLAREHRPASPSFPPLSPILLPVTFPLVPLNLSFHSILYRDHPSSFFCYFFDFDFCRERYIYMRNYLIRLEQKERKIQVIYPRFFERTMLRIFTTTYLRNYGLMNIGHESIRGLINFELKSIRPILASSKADAAMICTSAYLSRYHVSPILLTPSWILIFPLILIFHPLSRNKRKSYYIFPVSLRDIFRQSYFLAVKGCCLCQCSPMFVQCINSCRRCPRTCAVC